ncbi:MAG: ATP-binding cassette domain-containing protein [Epsilonproteobacteria bacterium]|nr:ATP-binding cassette domain-containing protein [Campylobacterota bacterium]
MIKKLKIKTKDYTSIPLVDIAFDITTSIALIGESGSGKSITIKALLDMLPSNLKMEIDYQSNFLLTKENIGYVPQNPFTSLSPLTPIKYQFSCNKNEQIRLLKLVNLETECLEKYPMQLSGGQLQRVVIAIALESNPKLLLLDEPTTALDTTNKNTIINLLNDLQSKLDFKMLFVTHDIHSIKNLCDNVLILKDGKICEFGTIANVLSKPTNSYTQNLIEANFANREFKQ